MGRSRVNDYVFWLGWIVRITSIIALYQDNKIESLWVAILLMVFPAAILIFFVVSLPKMMAHPKFPYGEPKKIISETVGTRKQTKYIRYAIRACDLSCGGYMTWFGSGQIVALGSLFSILTIIGIALSVTTKGQENDL